MSTSPLQGPIAKQIQEGMEGIMYDLTFVQVEESYDAGSGTTTTTETEFECKGFIGEFSQQSISDGLVQQNDSKITIIQNTLQDASGNKVEPSPGDEIKHDGDVYEIPDSDKPVSKDPADATWSVQGRN